MKVAEVAAAQAAALDPADIPPGRAIMIRYGKVCALIGPLSAEGEPMLVGELRHEDGRPLRLVQFGPGVADMLRTEFATREGLRWLLASLERLATGRRQVS